MCDLSGGHFLGVLMVLISGCAQLGGVAQQRAFRHLFVALFVHPVVRVAYACADVPLKVTVVEEWFHEDFQQCPVRAYGGVAGGGGGSERGVFFRSRSFVMMPTHGLPYVSSYFNRLFTNSTLSVNPFSASQCR